MANITQRKGKNGRVSYRIRVFAGIDLQGKQIFRSRTFTPKDGMSARQIEKALTKEALSFEEEVRRGGLSSPDMTVDEFLQKWLNEYAIKQLKIKTVKEYQGLLPRISAALGHIKLSKLTPGHIMQFYDQLAQQGIRLDAKYKARQLLIESCPKGQRKLLAQKAGISERTVAYIWAGHNTSLPTAQKISNAMNIAFRTPNKTEKRSKRQQG